MRTADLFKPEGRTRAFLGRAACFFFILFVLLLPAWADIYDKIDRLGEECRAGDAAACVELADIARNNGDGSVRLAAADNLADKSLAQTIYASLAKYDEDEEVRKAAVDKVTDKALLDNLSKHAKDGVVRWVATRKLNGQEPSDVAANHNKGKATAQAVEPDPEAQEANQAAEPSIPAVEQTAEPEPAQKTDGRKMGIYEFEFRAGVRIFLNYGISKVGGEMNEPDQNPEETSYFQELRTGLIKKTETVFKGNSLLHYVPARQLIYKDSEETLPPDVFIEKNDLFISLNVRLDFGVCVGWKKKLNISGVWNISNSSGYSVKIKTYCKSKESHGMFPNVYLPELGPVWLELATDSANQFLEKLAELMETDENLR